MLCVQDLQTAVTRPLCAALEVRQGQTHIRLIGQVLVLWLPEPIQGKIDETTISTT